MVKHNQILLILLSLSLFTACKKDQIELTPLASLNVTNAVVNGKNLKLGSNKQDSAVNMNFKQFGLLAGSSNVYLWPTGDSAHPYFNRTLPTGNGDVYSLFLAGNAAIQID